MPRTRLSRYGAENVELVDPIFIISSKLTDKDRQCKNDFRHKEISEYSVCGCNLHTLELKLGLPLFCILFRSCYAVSQS